MDILHRIKRLLLHGQYRFTVKAALELEADGLNRSDAIEAIVNATMIRKTLRSRSPRRASGFEKLYVIEGFTYDGTLIYTKGKITREAGEEVYYLLISSKRSRFAD